MEITLAEPERNGWICPKCSRSYSPLTVECKPCNDAVSARRATLQGGGRQIVQVGGRGY